MAVLARKVGLRHLELVEDAVQSALMTALGEWTAHGGPDDASAWLFRVAHNRVLQDLRRDAGQARIRERAAADLEGRGEDAVDPTFPAEIQDDLLRMLFVCCDDAIPWESQLVLALKTLCGFSTSEIALRLFTSEANVHKRLARARERLRDVLDDVLELGDLARLVNVGSRVAGVQHVLYLLFNEGYLSADTDHPIRRDLCDEAVRLATLLAEHPMGARPETFALLALMHLHVARLGSRVDHTGLLLLLEEQNRALWDSARLETGMAWLARSAEGAVFSRYHAEAAIAAEHGLSPSFEATRWEKIAELYAILEHLAPSPFHALNRAVAVAEWRGPDAGLEVLEGLAPPAWLTGSYLWDAVFGDLHRRAGHEELAARHRKRALAEAPTDAIRELLRRRLSPSK